ncbi:MAG: hypothetical protein WC346_03905 [Methanogenium sp.]|jgi:hypothetical protein
MKYDIDRILEVCINKDYKLYLNNDLDYNLNIIAIRNSNICSNRFNDKEYLIWKYKNTLYVKEYNVTTDPGLYYRLNPINKKGTAIVIPGQYPGLWNIGLHKGQYEALIQKKVCGVVRDFNKDSYLDCNPPIIYDRIIRHNQGINTIYDYVLDEDIIFTAEYGIFGINNHRSSTSVSTIVDKYSAGCIVHSDYNKYNEFMNICKKSSSLYGNSFTFTLLNDIDLL